MTRGKVFALYSRELPSLYGLLFLDFTQFFPNVEKRLRVSCNGICQEAFLLSGHRKCGGKYLSLYLTFFFTGGTLFRWEHLCVLTSDSSDGGTAAASCRQASLSSLFFWKPASQLANVSHAYCPRRVTKKVAVSLSFFVRAVINCLRPNYRPVMAKKASFPPRARSLCLPARWLAGAWVIPPE